MHAASQAPKVAFRFFSKFADCQMCGRGPHVRFEPARRTYEGLSPPVDVRVFLRRN